MPEELKQPYEVMSPVFADGVTYQVGESIELTEKQAQAMPTAVRKSSLEQRLVATPDTPLVNLNEALEADLLNLGLSQSIALKLVQARPITSLEEARVIVGKQKWTEISLGVTI